MGASGSRTSCHQMSSYSYTPILGELFHRVSLLIEEFRHRVPRHKKNTKKLIKSVLSNKHSQYVKVPLLVISSLLLQYYGQANFCFSELVIRICPVVVVWAILRMFGAFENSLEDLEILEESNAELGPGLAANYWFSFLKPALRADIQTKMEENLSSLRSLTDEMETDGEWKPQIGANYRNFNKLMIPLPDDCHLKIRDERILKEENIFKCTELCDGTEDSCQHNLEFRLEVGERRVSIKQTAYWIYESQEFEKEADTPEKKEKNRPGAREKNVRSFKKTLKSLLQ